jgi:hypothetical protein
MTGYDILGYVFVEKAARLMDQIEPKDSGVK